MPAKLRSKPSQTPTISTTTLINANTAIPSTSRKKPPFIPSNDNIATSRPKRNAARNVSFTMLHSPNSSSATSEDTSSLSSGSSSESSGSSTSSSSSSSGSSSGSSSDDTSSSSSSSDDEEGMALHSAQNIEQHKNKRQKDNTGAMVSLPAASHSTALFASLQQPVRLGADQHVAYDPAVINSNIDQTLSNVTEPTSALLSPPKTTPYLPAALALTVPLNSNTDTPHNIDTNGVPHHHNPSKHDHPHDPSLISTATPTVPPQEKPGRGRKRKQPPLSPGGAPPLPNPAPTPDPLPGKRLTKRQMSLLQIEQEQKAAPAAPPEVRMTRRRFQLEQAILPNSTPNESLMGSFQPGDGSNKRVSRRLEALRQQQQTDEQDVTTFPIITTAASMPSSPILVDDEDIPRRRGPGRLPKGIKKSLVMNKKYKKKDSMFVQALPTMPDHPEFYDSAIIITKDPFAGANYSLGASSEYYYGYEDSQGEKGLTVKADTSQQQTWGHILPLNHIRSTALLPHNAFSRRDNRKANVFTLNNVGNSCFINTFLQALIHIPSLAVNITSRTMVSVNKPYLMSLLSTHLTNLMTYLAQFPKTSEEINEEETEETDVNNKASQKTPDPDDAPVISLTLLPELQTHNTKATTLDTTHQHNSQKFLLLRSLMNNTSPNTFSSLLLQFIIQSGLYSFVSIIHPQQYHNNYRYYTHAYEINNCDDLPALYHAMANSELSVSFPTTFGPKAHGSTVTNDSGSLPSLSRSSSQTSTTGQPYMTNTILLNLPTVAEHPQVLSISPSDDIHAIPLPLPASPIYAAITPASESDILVTSSTPDPATAQGMYNSNSTVPATPASASTGADNLFSHVPANRGTRTRNGLGGSVMESSSKLFKKQQNIDDKYYYSLYQYPSSSSSPLTSTRSSPNASPCITPSSLAGKQLFGNYTKRLLFDLFLTAVSASVTSCVNDPNLAQIMRSEFIPIYPNPYFYDLRPITPQPFLHFLTKTFPHRGEDYNGLLQQDVHELYSDCLYQHFNYTREVLKERLIELFEPILTRYNPQIATVITKLVEPAEHSPMAPLKAPRRTSKNKKDKDELIPVSSSQQSDGAQSQQAPVYETTTVITTQENIKIDFSRITNELKDQYVGDLGLFCGTSLNTFICTQCHDRRCRTESFSALTVHVPSQDAPNTLPGTGDEVAVPAKKPVVKLPGFPVKKGQRGRKSLAQKEAERLEAERIETERLEALRIEAERIAEEQQAQADLYAQQTHQHDMVDDEPQVPNHAAIITSQHSQKSVPMELLHSDDVEMAHLDDGSLVEIDSNDNDALFQVLPYSQSNTQHNVSSHGNFGARDMTDSNTNTVFGKHTFQHENTLDDDVPTDIAPDIPFTDCPRETGGDDLVFETHGHSSHQQLSQRGLPSPAITKLTLHAESDPAFIQLDTAISGTFDPLRTTPTNNTPSLTSTIPPQASSSSLNITQLLSTVFTPIEVEVKCDKCKHNTSHCEMSLVDLPQVLVLHAQRWRYKYQHGHPQYYSRNNKLIKSQKVISIDETLNLVDYMHKTINSRRNGDTNDLENDMNDVERKAGEAKMAQRFEQDMEKMMTFVINNNNIISECADLLSSLGLELNIHPQILKRIYKTLIQQKHTAPSQQQQQSDITTPPALETGYTLYAIINHKGTTPNSGHYYIDINLRVIEKNSKYLQLPINSFCDVIAGAHDDLIVQQEQPDHTLSQFTLSTRPSELSSSFAFAQQEVVMKDKIHRRNSNVKSSELIQEQMTNMINTIQSMFVVNKDYYAKPLLTVPMTFDEHQDLAADGYLHRIGLKKLQQQHLSRNTVSNSSIGSVEGSTSATVAAQTVPSSRTQSPLLTPSSSILCSNIAPITIMNEADVITTSDSTDSNIDSSQSQPILHPSDEICNDPQSGPIPAPPSQHNWVRFDDNKAVYLPLTNPLESSKITAYMCFYIRNDLLVDSLSDGNVVIPSDPEIIEKLDQITKQGEITAPSLKI